MRTIKTSPNAFPDGQPYVDEITGNIWLYDASNSQWVLVFEPPVYGQRATIYFPSSWLFEQMFSWCDDHGMWWPAVMSIRQMGMVPRPNPPELTYEI